MVASLKGARPCWRAGSRMISAYSFTPRSVPVSEAEPTIMGTASPRAARSISSRSCRCHSWGLQRSSAPRGWRPISQLPESATIASGRRATPISKLPRSMGVKPRCPVGERMLRRSGMASGLALLPGRPCGAEREPEETTEGDEREEEPDPQPGHQRRAPVARQDRENGIEDAQPRRGPEPQVTEVRVVEADGKAPEVMIAPAQEPLALGEAMPRGVARAQRGVDGLGSLQPSLHREEHARREDRVEKRRRVPDGDPPVSGQACAEIRVVRVEARGGHAPGLLEERGQARGAGEVMGEAVLGTGLGLAPVDRLGDHGAHAYDGVRDRDEPDPAHVGASEHADVARAPSLGPGDALVLRMDGDVAQEGVEFVATELLREEAGPP